MIHNDKQQMEAIGYNKRYLGEPGNAPFFHRPLFSLKVGHQGHNLSISLSFLGQKQTIHAI